jgi:FkbM family methyltransferase
VVPAKQSQHYPTVLASIIMLFIFSDHRDGLAFAGHAIRSKEFCGGLACLIKLAMGNQITIKNMGIARNLLRHILKRTRYELAEKQQRLPTPTFDNVKLVLALYSITRTNPTFVQIGAYDGQTDDPASEYVQTGKMKCLLVEPIEASFQKLKKIYEGAPNVHLVQAAIGHSDGNAVMFRVKPGSKSDTINLHSGGWTSFNRAHLLKYRVQENEIEQVSVPCLTLKSLLVKFHLRKIDILQIDTEGFDAEIIKMALTLDDIPDCINFENIHLSLETKGELYDLLTQNGYFYSHDKYNTLALHRRLTDNLLALCRRKETLLAAIN